MSAKTRLDGDTFFVWVAHIQQKETACSLLLTILIALLLRAQDAALLFKLCFQHSGLG